MGREQSEGKSPITSALSQDQDAVDPERREGDGEGNDDENLGKQRSESDGGQEQTGLD